TAGIAPGRVPRSWRAPRALESNVPKATGHGWASTDEARDYLLRLVQVRARAHLQAARFLCLFEACALLPLVATPGGVVLTPTLLGSHCHASRRRSTRRERRGRRVGRRPALGVAHSHTRSLARSGARSNTSRSGATRMMAA